MYIAFKDWNNKTVRRLSKAIDTGWIENTCRALHSWPSSDELKKSNKKGLADNVISRGRKNLDVHVVLKTDSYLDLSNRRMFVVGD